METSRYEFAGTAEPLPLPLSHRMEEWGGERKPGQPRCLCWKRKVRHSSPQRYDRMTRERTNKRVGVECACDWYDRGRNVVRRVPFPSPQPSPPGRGGRTVAVLERSSSRARERSQPSPSPWGEGRGEGDREVTSFRTSLALFVASKSDGALRCGHGEHLRATSTDVGRLASRG
jgi:hypothetical protein